MILETSASPLLVDSWQRLLAERSKCQDTWLISPTDPVRGDGATRLSYSDLYEFSTRISRVLWKEGLQEGETAVLALENGPEFCLCFFALMLLGAVAVPFPPPYALRSKSAFRERLGQVVSHCSARYVIASSETSSVVGSSIPGLRVIEYDVLKGFATQALDLPARRQSELAVFQYTSGTTGVPRAVELTHGNILHNVNGIIRRMNGPSRDSVVVCWLPMFHDMGLIASMLAATYTGGSLVMLTPQQFVTRPESWLWAIARFGGTVSAAPNFAYRFCLQRVRDEKIFDLDLGTWTAALTGAESIDADVVHGFEQRFSAYGLPSSSTLPVYGLAEDTVACCFPERGSGAQFDVVSRNLVQSYGRASSVASGRLATRQIASVGTPLPGQRVRIVTEVGQAQEREIGEIQVNGSCIMRAYHRDPDATAAALGADGWLKTGDQGYIANGRLFVVGRLSDVIKRAGSRYDAADIVAAVHRLEGLHGRVAAFSVLDDKLGRERVVILAESDSAMSEGSGHLERAVREIVHERIGIQPDDVRFVERGSLPRTTSGKINNRSAQAAFVAAVDVAAGQSTFSPSQG